VPGEILFADPQVKLRAQTAGRELLFDFTDDRAVLSMLRSRHDDEEVMFGNGAKWGIPLAVIGLFAVLYWAGVVRYWESSSARSGYLAVASVLIMLLVFFFVRSAVKTWGNRSRQNLRARAHKYRELAHAARRAGVDVPNHYPHYGPYPFAADFHRETALAESDEKRKR
jgi:hypothetical protein